MSQHFFGHLCESRGFCAPAVNVSDNDFLHIFSQSVAFSGFLPGCLVVLYLLNSIGEEGGALLVVIGIQGIDGLDFSTCLLLHGGRSARDMEEAEEGCSAQHGHDDV